MNRQIILSVFTLFLRRSMILSAGLLLMIFSLIFLACDRNKLFEQNVTIEKSSWSKNQILRFPVIINDTSDYYNILLDIRNEGNYPYSNLYLFINVTSPEGNTITDTLDIELADNRGKWHGTGLGDLFFLQFPYKTNIRFPVPGIYTFKLVQGMRPDALDGIRNIGLRIEKVKP